MAKGVLIAPADGRLEQTLIDRFVRSGLQVLAAGTNESIREEERVHCCEWDVRSFVSARNVVLTAIAKLDGLDNVVLVHSNRGERQTIHELSPREIESGLDIGLKGFILLLRELIPHFLKRRSGHISFVLYRPEEEASTPLSAATADGFTSLVRTLFAVYHDSGFTMSAFESKKDDVEGFADFVLRATTERNGDAQGKLLRYGAKPLQRLGITRR